MILHLGVNDIPYARAQAAQRRGAKRALSAISSTSTGDVAEILEHRYGVMGKFWELHGQECADDLAEVMAGKLEDLMMGGPAPERLLEDSDTGKIEERFREMLDKRELDGKVDGVPTAASLAGVNHRLSHPYARREARPSFIDTGLYQANMRAWIEE